MNPFAKAEFVSSLRSLDTLPHSRGEIAFAGRSNSGKSTALNVIVGHHVARESKTPGRTQGINYFALGSDLFMVDLPGYGYAKVPKSVSAGWDALLGGYLQTRQELLGLVLMMDARHPLQKLDWQMLEWFRPTGKPIHLLLTKTDKLSRNEGAAVLALVTRELRDFPGITIQLFSGHSRAGVPEAIHLLSAWLTTV